MRPWSWLLLVVLAAACADTGGSAAGTQGSPCDDVACSLGMVCVGGVCRDGGGLPDASGPDAEDDLPDTSAPGDAGDDVSDVPDGVDAADVPNVPDVPDEPDTPAPHAEVTVEPAMLAMTVASEGEQIERNLTIFNVGNRAVRVQGAGTAEGDWSRNPTKRC